MKFDVEKTVSYWVSGAEYDFEARYPEDQLKFYRKCTRIFTEKNLDAIKEVYQWLKKKL